MTPRAVLAHSGLSGWLILLIAPLVVVAAWEWIERRRSGRSRSDRL